MELINVTSYADNNIIWMNNSVNHTEGLDATTRIYPLSRAVSVGLILGIIVMFALVGNVLVILAVFTNRRLRTVTNCFVVSLATADLLVSCLVMPLSISIEISGDWLLGPYVCDLWISCDVMLCTASILNLCCISLDRYFAITKPLIYATKRSKRMALIMIAIVWVLSAAITCPPILGWRESGRGRDEKKCTLTRDPGYIIYSSLGSFYLPLVIMLFVYARIFKVAQEREKRLRPYRKSFIRKATCNGPYSEHETQIDMHAVSVSESESDSNDRTTVDAITPPTKRFTLTFSRGGHHDRVITNSIRVKMSPQTRRPLIYYQSGDAKLATNGNHIRHDHNLKDKTLRDCRKRERAILMKERKAAKTLAIVVGGFVVCWLPFFLMYVIDPFCTGCHIDEHMSSFFTWLGYFNSVMNPCIYALYNKDFRYSFYKILCSRCYACCERESHRDGLNNNAR